MTIADFDDVFEHIGGFGPYQYIIFALICVFNVFFGFSFHGQMFMALTPPHHCKPPDELEDFIKLNFNLELSEEELVRFAIPIAEDGVTFEKCKRYDINFTEVKEWGLFKQDQKWPTLECDNGWDYNFTSYYPSISSKLNWVCSDDWKPPFAQSCFFIGGIIGVPFFGWLADKYGRLPIIILTNMLGGVMGVASSFSGSFIAFCIMRFFVGLAVDSNLMIIYILGLEFVSPKYRTIVSNVPILLFLTASMVCLPWIAYFIHDWVVFGVVIHAPMLLTVLIIFVAPESVRWLIGKGKSEKAINIVEKAAKINGKTLSEDFFKSFNAYLERSASTMTKDATCIDLLKLPNLRKRFILLTAMWVAIYLAYDGYLKHTEKIGFDFFVTFTITGAIELPADLLAMFLMEWIGRKHAVVWTLVLSGMLSMTILIIDQSEVLKLVMLSVTERFLLIIALNVAMQYILEVLPTAGRTQGSSAIHAIGYGMAFVTPYIVYLSKIRHWIPYAIFGLISILGGLSSLWLPETMGEKLPDSLKDGEEFFKDQSIFGNPLKRKNKN